jgi:hypothetical protein
MNHFLLELYFISLADPADSPLAAERGGVAMPG